MQIVQDCLANGCDYGATALKYNVDYKALVQLGGAVPRPRPGGPARQPATAARGRAAPRAVRAPWRRCSGWSLCWTVWKTGKITALWRRNTPIAYHQVYRWVQRYLQDGWLGMNDRRGPADDPDPAGEWGEDGPRR